MAFQNRFHEETSAICGRAAALPVTFAGTVGLFKPAAGKPSGTAVLFLSPWGFEEMCTRKFWRILAEELSDAGIPSLRFDYIGTGDALDTGGSEGLSAWHETADAAAEYLKSLSGCDSVILVGQGLGGAIAVETGARLPGVAGIALLAPVTSGRLYLRELGFWSKMIDESLGLSEHGRSSEGVSVAGLVMPDAVAADLRRLDLMTCESFPAADSLVLTRPGRPTDSALARKLTAVGVKVREEVYEGYDALVSNPTTAEMPGHAGAVIIDWVRSIVARHADGPARMPISKSSAAPLRGDGFCETPLRFGGNDRLFGVLCQPDGPTTGATALLLTTAYDRSAGWARSSVTMARRLARHGIASLRFDTANVADSPPRPGAPDQVLYAESQLQDVADALQLLEDRDLLPAFVVGRCSGGYLAFQSALHDARCRGLVAANAPTFHWDPAQSVDMTLRGVPRSLATYRRKLLRRETLQRLISGRIDMAGAGRNVMTSLAGRLSHLCRPMLDLFPFLSREHAAIVDGFRTLGTRNVPVSLVYSAEDIGLEYARKHFGSERARLKNYPHLRVTVVSDADHNLTPPHAQDVYFKEIRLVALSIGGEHARVVATSEDDAVRPRGYAGFQAS